MVAVAAVMVLADGLAWMKRGEVAAGDPWCQKTWGDRLVEWQWEWKHYLVSCHTRGWQGKGWAQTAVAFHWVERFVGRIEELSLIQVVDS